MGIVTIVHKGVIVAAALGTDTLLFRQPTREAADRLGELLLAAREY